MVESQVGMFLFGVAAAYGSVLLFVWVGRWRECRQRRSHVKRGKSYWDAILAEDKRKRGESL